MDDRNKAAVAYWPSRHYDWTSLRITTKSSATNSTDRYSSSNSTATYHPHTTFIYNLVSDFVALLLTRSVAGYVFSRSHSIPSFGVFAILLIISCLILVISSLFMDLSVVIGSYILQIPSGTSGQSIYSPLNYLRAILFPLYKNDPELLGDWQMLTVYGVFVWSTLTGVFWLGIFSISVVIANFSTRLAAVGPWLNSKFKVQREPFLILAIIAVIVVTFPCLIFHIL